MENPPSNLNKTNNQAHPISEQTPPPKNPPPKTPPPTQNLENKRQYDQKPKNFIPDNLCPIGPFSPRTNRLLTSPINVNSLKCRTKNIKQKTLQIKTPLLPFRDAIAHRRVLGSI